MDPITQQATIAAAGAGGGDPLYVDDVFSTFLTDGNSGTQTITNGIDLAGEGGLVWSKLRSGGNYKHALSDTEQGVGKYLSSNENAVITPNSADITAFNSNGFSVGSATTRNSSGYNYAHWTFRKAPGFFDVVTWTGNSTAGRQISHSLGSVPGMIIIKCTSGSDNWYVHHRSLGATQITLLNYNNAAYTSDKFNDTLPTSTHFELPADASTNGSGRTYVAYIFAHDDQSFGTGGNESIIKCESATTSATTWQDFNLGFEPQWLLIKTTSFALDWHIFDNMRGVITGGADAGIRPNLNNVEAPSDYVEFTPTGFRISTGNFGQGQTIVYMAIRRPNKPPTAATEVFSPNAQTSGSQVTTGFVTDTAIFAQRAALSEFQWFDRVKGREFVSSDGNYAGSTRSGTTGVHWDYQNGYNEDAALSTKMGSNAASIYYGLKRAPGFFDVVAYEGNATAGTAIAHNLEAVPEFIICKCRNQSAGFWCYHKDLSTNNAIRMDGSSNGNAAEQGSSNYWNSSTHSATTFTLGNYGDINGSNKKFIAYLFATLPGISKVGSYSGSNNSTVTVNCGFTGAPRFLIIKRIDAAGGWQVWDSARGINSGTNSYDPFKYLNSNAAEAIYGDYIDPTTSGFTVKPAGTGAGLNSTGGTYLFLAIA